MGTLDLILRLLPLGVLILQGVLTWLLWSIRSSFVAKAECQNCRESINGRLTSLTQDAAVADARRDGLATAREVAEVKTAVVEVREQIKALAEVLKRVEQPVRLLMDYHLERDSK